MDPVRRRELKQLGKKEVERRSAELQNTLSAANPSPVGSDEWARGYKLGIQREKWLRKKLPLLTPDELASMFVVHDATDPGWTAHGGSSGYLRCNKCGCAAPSVLPDTWFYWSSCSCGNIRLRRILFWKVILAKDPSELTPVKLVGRG
jgi:hypothetical protein